MHCVSHIIYPRCVSQSSHIHYPFTQLAAAAAHRAQRALRIAALPRDSATGLIAMPLEVPIARSAFETTFQRQMNYRTDAMRVLALGEIVTDRPKFHTDKHIVRVCGGYFFSMFRDSFHCLLYVRGYAAIDCLDWLVQSNIVGEV